MVSVTINVILVPSITGCDTTSLLSKVNSVILASELWSEANFVPTKSTFTVIAAPSWVAFTLITISSFSPVIVPFITTSQSPTIGKDSFCSPSNWQALSPCFSTLHLSTEMFPSAIAPKLKFFSSILIRLSPTFVTYTFWGRSAPTFVPSRSTSSVPLYTPSNSVPIGSTLSSSLQAENRPSMQSKPKKYINFVFINLLVN